MIKPHQSPETWQYQYDVLGRRISKRLKNGENLQETCFVWDGSHLVQEENANSKYSYIYTHPSSYEPLAQLEFAKNSKNPTACYYFHNDQIGVPRELTDEQGRLCWYGDYSGWGKLKNEYALVENIHQPFRLQNQYADEETGLHYNFFRYYEPNVGRFTQLDPIGLAGGENLYRFADNVQQWIDPLGLWVWLFLRTAAVNGARGSATATVTATDATIIGAAGIYSIDNARRKDSAIADLNKAKIGQCKKDPCSDYPTRSEAKKQALASSQLTENDLIGKRGVQGWEQYAYSTYPREDIKIVSHHPSDSDHPCPHWHISNAKIDNGEIQTFSHGAWKYQGGGAVFPHRFN